MNKFDFIGRNPTNKIQTVKTEFSTLRQYGEGFTLIFSGNKQSGNVFEGRLIQPIIKSDIQEYLKTQIREMIQKISKEEKSILCFKMNKTTQNKLRTFLSYEIDYVPRNNKIKEIVGSLYGIAIVLDEKLKDFVMIPFIKDNPKRRKYTMLSKELK